MPGNLENSAVATGLEKESSLRPLFQELIPLMRAPPPCPAKLSRFSRVRLCVTPWTAAHQTPLSLGFSRKEYWSGLPHLWGL